MAMFNESKPNGSEMSDLMIGLNYINIKQTEQINEWHWMIHSQCSDVRPSNL